MKSLAIDTLRDLGGIKVHTGLGLPLLDQFQASVGFTLPLEHAELLRWSNGVEAYAGYFRLFGVDVGADASVDSIVWNRHDYWKFAWGNRCSAYWCFGETAWGDQYAYTIESLQAGRTAEIYFLDALSMTPQAIAASFPEFLEAEFLRSAREPYDELICLAHDKFGPLDTTSHLVYVPSPLVGGTEAIENVQPMNARAAMICNGDLATQLDNGPPNGKVKSVQPYQDAQGRMRLRIEWA